MARTDLGIPMTEPVTHVVSCVDTCPPSCGRIRQGDAAPDRPGGERDDERLQAGVADDRAVDGAAEGAQRYDDASSSPTSAPP